jgi:hypothetical protein
MKRTIVIAAATLLLALGSATPVPAEAGASATSALISVGSAPNLVVRNMQAEPAVAVDASRPDVLAAGASDFIDVQPCIGRVCKGSGRGLEIRASTFPSIAARAGCSPLHRSHRTGLQHHRAL